MRILCRDAAGLYSVQSHPGISGTHHLICQESVNKWTFTIYGGAFYTGRKQNPSSGIQCNVQHLPRKHSCSGTVGFGSYLALQAPLEPPAALLAEQTHPSRAPRFVPDLPGQTFSPKHPTPLTSPPYCTCTSLELSSAPR